MPSAPPASYAPVRARGWNTWNTRSVLSHVCLPEGVALNLSFYHHGMLTAIADTAFGRKRIGATAGVKLADGEIARRNVSVWPGAHAYDGGYTALSIELGDVTIGIESARAGENDIVLLIKPTAAKYRPPSLVVEGAFLWNRPGAFEADASRPRTFHARAGDGGRGFSFYCTAEPVTQPYLAQRFPSWVFPLDKPIGISSSGERSLPEIASLIAQAREREARAHARYGAAAERHAAAQACLAWNTVYEPVHDRIITTPSRQWNVDRHGYGIFCWDSFFMGWLLAIDDAALGRACVSEIFREMVRTPDGDFVPNVVNGSGRSSRDRSQPCIGGMGVLALHELAPDEAFLRSVWKPLLAWNRWWDRRRRNAHGLISPGSHPFAPVVGDLAELMQPNTLRGATLEAGPDNTPLYENIPFDTNTHLMSASDVGLSALYILDCEALAVLARKLGHDAEAAELQLRHDDYAGRLSHLWNDTAGIFQTRRTDTDEYINRISPVCLYPLLTAAVTPAQRARMIDGHLLNGEEFWGEWVIPSVPRNDPAFPEQHYWRGRIWAPMNFLIYLGLKRSGRDDAAAELVCRSTRLFDKNWSERRGLFENFSAITGVGGDVELCDPMCTWTGLLVLMELIENKTVPLPSLFWPGKLGS